MAFWSGRFVALQTQRAHMSLLVGDKYFPLETRRMSGTLVGLRWDHRFHKCFPSVGLEGCPGLKWTDWNSDTVWGYFATQIHKADPGTPKSECFLLALWRLGRGRSRFAAREEINQSQAKPEVRNSEDAEGPRMFPEEQRGHVTWYPVSFGTVWGVALECLLWSSVLHGPMKERAVCSWATCTAEFWGSWSTENPCIWGQPPSLNQPSALQTFMWQSWQAGQGPISQYLLEAGQ